MSGDDALDEAIRASHAAGLPEHQVAPNQGKLLMLLALMVCARRVLEIGTLGGYSTIWLARALPADGRLVTLEADLRHAAVARTNIQRAGLSSIVEVVDGPASDSLARLADGDAAPFDLVFIDADKVNNPVYLEWALRLTRPGSVIIADNVVRNGSVVDGASHDPSVRGIRRFIELCAGEPRLVATAIQTVGAKGYDGFAIALVTDV